MIFKSEWVKIRKINLHFGRETNMENFSVLLFFISILLLIVFCVLFIKSKIKKTNKKKKYLIGILISIVLFIVSVVLFGIFETPETKAEYEARQVEKQLEK